MKIECAMVATNDTKEQIINVIKSANLLSENELEWYICPDFKVNLNYFDFLKDEITFKKLLPQIEEDKIFGADIHGRGIDIIINNLKSKYIMICDTDVVFTYKNWDTYMINLLNENKIIVGSETWALNDNNERYPKVPHFYRNFPIMGPIILLDREKHLITNTSFVKKKLIDSKVINNRPKYINKKIWIQGGQIIIDDNLEQFWPHNFNKKQNLLGGWRVPISYMENGYKNDTLPTTKKNYHFIYTKDLKNIILVHHGGGGGEQNGKIKNDESFNEKYKLFLNHCFKLIKKQNQIIYNE